MPQWRWDNHKVGLHDSHTSRTDLVSIGTDDSQRKAVPVARRRHLGTPNLLDFLAGEFLGSVVPSASRQDLQMGLICANKKGIFH